MKPGGETARVPLLAGHGDGLVQSNGHDKDCRVYFILLWPYLCNFLDQWEDCLAWGEHAGNIDNQTRILRIVELFEQVHQYHK